jgi:hypothetical protein
MLRRSTFSPAPVWQHKVAGHGTPECRGLRKNAGDWKAARALVQEARVLSKALGDVRVHDHCEAQLAMIAFAAG